MTPAQTKAKRAAQRKARLARKAQEAAVETPDLLGALEESLKPLAKYQTGGVVRVESPGHLPRFGLS